MVHTDETDKKLLELLKRDSISTNAVLGKAVALSEGAVRKRIEAMKKSGVISRFTIDVRGAGAAVRALAFITLEPHASNVQLCKKISAMQGVDNVWETIGVKDICVVLSSFTMDELNSELDTIRGLAGVATTETFVISKEWL